MRGSSLFSGLDLPRIESGAQFCGSVEGPDAVTEDIRKAKEGHTMSPPRHRWCRMTGITHFLPGMKISDGGSLATARLVARLALLHPFYTSSTITPASTLFTLVSFLSRAVLIIPNDSYTRLLGLSQDEQS